jgi:hypothetical protein
VKRKHEVRDRWDQPESLNSRWTNGEALLFEVTGNSRDRGAVVEGAELQGVDVPVTKGLQRAVPDDEDTREVEGGAPGGEYGSETVARDEDR